MQCVKSCAFRFALHVRRRLAWHRQSVIKWHAMAAGRAIVGGQNRLVSGMCQKAFKDHSGHLSPARVW